ncbi:MAG: chorismate mutase [Rhodospirillaceae bacterium]|nr:chorismate mutase [Rhodospirillaceae bacterium]|tara:strand:- start:79 stop:405 length:327 start_codon:yes stop_codon:yes gene_type:complete
MNSITNTLKDFEECETLDEVREHIDSLDLQIVPLLLERNHYVGQAAKLKGNVDAARVPWRIEEVIKKVRATSVLLGQDTKIVEDIYREMIEINIKEEQSQIAQRKTNK